MRLLTCLLPAGAALAALLALAPAPAQAASGLAVASVQDDNVQAVANGCGPRHHRIWRRGRSWCVRN